MTNPAWSGFGFSGLEQIHHQTSQIPDLQVAWEQAKEDLRAYNEALMRVVSTFALPTTRGQFRYKLSNTTNYQVLDDKGNPLPVSDYGFYDVGLPLRGAGTAFGDNLVTRAHLTQDDIDARRRMAENADLNWMRRHIMAALFTNTDYQFTSVFIPEETPVTVRPLATSASGIEWLKRDGLKSVDDHYLAQASTISDTNNPFPVLYEELAEHPSNNVNPSSPIVAYIPTNLQASVEALTSFVPLPRMFIKEGANTPVALQGQQYGYFGEFLGVVGGVNNSVVVRVWSHLPDNYIVAHALGAGPVLGMRQFAAPELQGVVATLNEVDGNYIEMQFRRFAGFGVLNPLGACVMQIGNATYQIPNGYQAPLAV